MNVKKSVIIILVKQLYSQQGSALYAQLLINITSPMLLQKQISRWYLLDTDH